MDMIRIFVIRLLSSIFGFIAYSVLFFRSRFSSPKKVASRTKPSVLTDPRWGHHGTVSLPKAGIKLHIVENDASPEKKKPLMLFIHGFPEFWYSWRHQLRYFSDRYKCVAVDARGYNESDKPEGLENYSLIKLSDDIEELIKELGYEKCILIGHDWGGLIAYTVTARFPEMVSILFALNIAHPASFKRELSKNWSQRLKSWYIMFFQCPSVPERFLEFNDFEIFDKLAKECDLDEESVESYKYAFSQTGGFTGPLNYYRSSFQRPIVIPELEKIHVPVCSIYGVLDAYVGKECVHGSKDFVDDFTLKEIPDVNHFVQSKAPRSVNSLMDEYLELKKDFI